jgi:probable F420-dependent oxidoreductase
VACQFLGGFSFYVQRSHDLGVRFDMMITAAPLVQVAQMARDAKEVGFDGLVVTEGGRSAYLSCAAAALASDVEVATGIAVAFPRSPMVTAQVAWELTEATKGQFRLGLGTQVRAHITRRYGSEFDPPGPRLEEYVRALKAIFTAFRGGAPLDFKGRWWSMSLLPASWSPGPIPYPDPPVDLAAVNPWMLQMAGRVADGVHVHPLNNPVYLRDVVLPSLAHGASQAGRDPSQLVLNVPVFTAVGDSDEEQSKWWEMARAQVAFYGSTPNYAFIFDLLGYEGTTQKIRERQKAGDLAGMAAVVSDEILAHFALRGSWSEMGRAIASRLAPVADRVILYFAGLTWHEGPRSFERWSQVLSDARSALGHLDKG